jgi:hypothetical protein
MANVTLNKEVYQKDQFQKVINTNFTQLVNTTPQVTSSVSSFIVTPENVNLKITQFFIDYQNLFFDIPKFGDTNSHEYLVKTSSEYIGTSTFPNDTVQALIEEINNLREQNLQLTQQLISGSI